MTISVLSTGGGGGGTGWMGQDIFAEMACLKKENLASHSVVFPKGTSHNECSVTESMKHNRQGRHARRTQCEPRTTLLAPPPPAAHALYLKEGQFDAEILQRRKASRQVVRQRLLQHNSVKHSPLVFIVRR